MDENLKHFYDSIQNIQYKVIQTGLTYSLNFITPDILEMCNKLKVVYDSHHLYKIAPFYYISNSFIYNYLHIILLFDHSFVSTNYKRNSIAKLTKVKNDTINNLLYLYCKQSGASELQTIFNESIDKYIYDLDYVIKLINDIYEKSHLSIDQRINIMIHCNDNESLQKHENIIINKIFIAYYNTIDELGKYLTTQNACLTDESP